MGSHAPLRSRKGCWTCRDRHKKCDEEKPECFRCQKAGRTCGGYGQRLTWLKPRRVTRRAKTPTPEIALDLDASGCSSSETTSPSDPWCVGSPRSGPDVEALLFEKFRCSGQYTLAGRTARGDESMNQILSLCSSWPALRCVVLAYQAHLDLDYRSLSAVYLDQALEIYQTHLRDPERLVHDATLITGILLCSVGIAGNMQWTMHLDGLEAILIQRGSMDPYNRPPPIANLVEVVGLFDLPTVTIGRIHSKRKLWARFVTPSQTLGIEPTSGLPRSLLNIVSLLGSKDVEHSLLSWPGERGEDYAHHFLWEAFRYSAVLNNRALMTPRNNFLDTPVILMKILASVEALWQMKRDPFKQPLRTTVLFPLFTAGLYVDEDSRDKEFVTECFQKLMAEENSRYSLAWDILLETWGRRTEHLYESLHIADRFAMEMGVELHLY